MNGYFVSIRTRRITTLICGVLLALLLSTTFFSSYQAHAAPPPPPPVSGDITASADVHGIPGVSSVTEYVFPGLGEAQVDFHNAQGQTVEQDDVYFTPTNGNTPPSGVTPTHPIIITTGTNDRSINNGNNGNNLFNHGTYRNEIRREWAHVFHDGFLEYDTPLPFHHNYALQVLNGTYQRIDVPVHSADPELAAWTLDFTNTTNELTTVMNQIYANTSFLALGAIATLIANFAFHSKGEGFTIAFLVVAAITNVVRETYNKWLDAKRLHTKLLRLFNLIYAHKHGGRGDEPPPPPPGDPSSSFSNMQVRRG